MKSFFLILGFLVQTACADVWQDPIHLSVTNDVGFGNSMFVVGNDPGLGAWDPVHAVRMRFTPGNVWTTSVAVAREQVLEYKLIQRSTEASQWCDPDNAVWPAGANESISIRPVPTPPRAGKTILYHSGWSNVFVNVENQDLPMHPVGAGRADGETLYRIDNVLTMGRSIEFFFHNGEGGNDFAPYPGFGPGSDNHYATALDTFFVQDGEVFNYEPPTSVSPSSNVVVCVNSSLQTIPGRNVHVYLPRGYTENQWKRYPVLYMHDAQDLFYAGGSDFDQWDIDRTLDREISQGRCREVIVVAIENNSNRSGEYMPPGDVYPPDPRPAVGDQYLNFVVDHVRPFADDAFRTLNDPGNTLIAGSSLGGLISTYFGYETNVFQTVGAFSPGFARATNYLEQLRIRPKPNLRLFIDHGTLEENVNGANYWTYPQIAYDIFLERGFVPNHDLLFRVGCDRGHERRLWGEHMEDFLRFALPAYKEANRLSLQIHPRKIRDADPGHLWIMQEFGEETSLYEIPDLQQTNALLSQEVGPAKVPWRSLSLAVTNAPAYRAEYKIAH